MLCELGLLHRVPSYGILQLPTALPNPCEPNYSHSCCKSHTMVLALRECFVLLLICINQFICLLQHGWILVAELLWNGCITSLGRFSKSPRNSGSTGLPFKLVKHLSIHLLTYFFMNNSDIFRKSCISQPLNKVKSRCDSIETKGKLVK